MRKLQFKWNKLYIFLVLSLFLVPSVFADGMIHVYDRDMWQLHNEKQQLCAINYKDGYQNMILSVDVDELRGEKAVWIFPVPAKPEETVIDIMKGFPQLRGYDIKDRVDSEIKEVFMAMRFTQIYTFPYELFFGRVFIAEAKMMGAAEAAAEPSVQVHEHIEKMGLTTELITAKDGTSFWNWLTLRGLEIPEDSKSVLNGYIGEDYSFVVSWISDVEEFKRNQAPYYYQGEYAGSSSGMAKPIGERYYDGMANVLGVYLRFPTDKIYYPLKPTSVYGSLRVPTLIYVMDFVEPEFYPKIKQDATVTYYASGSYYPTIELQEFFNTKESIRDFKYTKIKLNPPSKYLTDDLWIKEGAPVSIKGANFIIRHTFWFGIIFFIICSCLASMISGMIFFRKDVSKQKLALWGLWNFTTLVGFIIATIFLKTRQVDAKLAKALKQKGLVVKARDLRKIVYVVVFSLVFVGLTFLFRYIFTAVF